MTTEEWKVGAWERLQANPDYLDKLLNVHPNDKKLFMPLLYEMYLEHDATPPQVVTQSLPLQHRVSTARQRLETQAKRARPEVIEKVAKEVGKIGEIKKFPAVGGEVTEAIPEGITEGGVRQELIEHAQKVLGMAEPTPALELRAKEKLTLEERKRQREQEEAAIILSGGPTPDLTRARMWIEEHKPKGMRKPRGYETLKSQYFRQIQKMAQMNLGTFSEEDWKELQEDRGSDILPPMWYGKSKEEINAMHNAILDRSFGGNAREFARHFGLATPPAIAVRMVGGVPTDPMQAAWNEWNAGTHPVGAIAGTLAGTAATWGLMHQMISEAMMSPALKGAFKAMKAKKAAPVDKEMVADFLNRRVVDLMYKNVGSEKLPDMARDLGAILEKRGWVKTVDPNTKVVFWRSPDGSMTFPNPEYWGTIIEGAKTPPVLGMKPGAVGAKPPPTIATGGPLVPTKGGVLDVSQLVPKAPQIPVVPLVVPAISDAMVNALKVSQRGIKVLVQGAQKAVQAGNNEEALRLLHEARAATQSAKVGGAIDKAIQGIPEAEKIVPEAFSPAHIRQMKAQARDTRSINNLQDLDKRFDRSNKALGIQAARKIQQGAVDEGGELLHQGVEQQEAQLLVAQANEAMQAGDKQKVLDLLDQARPLITSERLLESVDKLAFSIQNPPSTPKPPEGSDAGFLGDQYGRANVDRTLGEAEKGPPFLQRIQQWYHRFYAQNVGGLQSHANWAADAAKKAADKHYVAVKKVEQEGLKPAIASARTAWKATDITDAEGHPFSYKKALDQVRLYLKAKEAPVGHEVLERLEKELTGYPPEMFRIAEIQNRTEAMKRQNKLIKDMHETVEILFRTNLGVEGTISKVLSTYGTYTVDAQGYMTRTGESYQDIVRPVYRQGLGEASENLWVALRNLEFAKNGVSIPDYYGLYQNDRLVGIVEQDMPHLKNYAKSHDLEIKVVGKIPQHLTDKEGNAVYEIRSLDGIDAAEATVADYSKHPDQQLLFDTNKREVALMRRLLDEMKNVGLISQESFDAMVAKGNYYLPIARIFEELQVGTEGEEIALIAPGTDLTRGTENTFKHLQHVTGTKETNKIVPPGMETVNYIAQAIRLIENHRAAQSLLDLHKITNEFMGELPQEADRALLTKMEQELKPMKLNEQLSKADKKAGYRTVATVSHGVPVQYRVHPELYKTLRGTSGQEMNAALKLASQILSPVARSLRVGTTGALGFEFMLRNMPRDLIEQWRNDPLLRYTPFINLPIGVWVLLKGHTVNALANWGVLPKIEKALGVKPGTILSKDTLQQYYTSGAGLATMMEALGLPRPDIERVTFQLQYGSLEARAKYIEATWRSPNLNSAQKAKAIAKELNVPEIVVLELLEHVKNQTELVTRVGLFAWHKIRGHSDKKAAYWSRVSSVDFAQRGYSNLAKALVKSTAYLGPAANSIDQFFRRWTKTPLNALITGLILTLGAVGIWLRNNLDPKRRKVYQSLSADTKNLYFCFITEVDKKTAEDWYNSGYVEVKSEEERYYLVYKAPKPFESAAIFCTLPELSLDWLISQDPHALDDAPKALAQSFGFPLIPTALLPLIEVSINPERGGYSFFYGRHIAPANVWGLTRAEQYTPSTPQPYVAAAQTKMAKRLGIAPWQVEYIVSRYIGPGGAQLIKAFDQPMREKGIEPERPLRPTIPKVKQYLTRVLVGGEPMGFGTRQAEEFGDLYYGPRGIQKSYNTLREKINNVWDESHLQHAESYITPEVLAYPFFNEANGIVGLFSGIKRVATNSRALTQDEMANYMTQMDYFITQVHDITLNEYNQFKEEADDWSVTQKQEYLLDYKEGRMTEQEEHLWDNLEPYLIPSIGVSAGRKTVEEVVDDLWTRLSTAQRTARTNKDEVLWQQIEDNLNALDELEKTLMNKL